MITRRRQGIGPKFGGGGDDDDKERRGGFAVSSARPEATPAAGCQETGTGGGADADVVDRRKGFGCADAELNADVVPSMQSTTGPRTSIRHSCDGTSILTRTSCTTVPCPRNEHERSSSSARYPRHDDDRDCRGSTRTEVAGKISTYAARARRKNNIECNDDDNSVARTNILVPLRLLAPLVRYVVSTIFLAWWWWCSSDGTVMSSKVDGNRSDGMMVKTARQPPTAPPEQRVLVPFFWFNGVSAFRYGTDTGSGGSCRGRQQRHRRVGRPQEPLHSVYRGPTNTIRGSATAFQTGTRRTGKLLRRKNDRGTAQHGLDDDEEYYESIVDGAHVEDCSSRIDRRKDIGASGRDFDSGSRSSSSGSSSTPKTGAATRRAFLRHQTLGMATAGWFSSSLVRNESPLFPEPAHAALLQFPMEDEELKNTYHLMRTGKSMFEEQDIWSTNPLFLTNREDCLSPAGESAAKQAAAQLKERNVSPTIITHSLAASCIDTANIIGQQLKLGRDRISPEFTYLDPRGVGKWDMLSRSKTVPAVWAMDNDESNEAGNGGRPPPNEDSTPNETLSDQVIRLRQYLSLLEQRSSGETILMIFPDGTGPALLSCMIAGIPYNRVHELEFASGELRLNVKKSTTLALWEKRKLDASFMESYRNSLDEGRKTLVELRESPESIVSIRDQQIEQERVEIEREYQAQQRERARIEKEKEIQARLERQREIEASRGDGADTGEMSPAVVGIGSLVGIGGGALAFASSLDGDEDKAKKNATVTSTTLYDGIDEMPTTTNTTKMGLKRINGDSSKKKDLFDDIPPPKPSDPYEAAQQAMQEYLDRDDGAEAWLTSILDIVAEDEDEPDAGGSENTDMQSQAPPSSSDDPSDET